MGHENGNGPFVAYIDGQPVKISQPLPEIEPDYSAGGVSAEEASTAMATASKVWANLSMTMEVAVEGLREIFNAIELDIALRFARMFYPALFYRYRHTKKKRVRKKYEKRIRARLREVFRTNA